jgi:hypothetical protein
MIEGSIVGVQTDSGVHPASFPVDTGLFHRG